MLRSDWYNVAEWWIVPKSYCLYICMVQDHILQREITGYQWQSSNSKRGQITADNRLIWFFFCVINWMEKLVDASYFSFSANKGVLECVLFFFFLEVRQSFLTSISSCLSPHVLTVCVHQVSPLARLINELNLSSHMKSNEAHWAQHEFLTETTETKVSAKATKIFGACCEEWVVKIQEFLFTIEFYCADVKTCC